MQYQFREPRSAIRLALAFTNRRMRSRFSCHFFSCAYALRPDALHANANGTSATVHGLWFRLLCFCDLLSKRETKVDVNADNSADDDKTVRQFFTHVRQWCNSIPFTSWTIVRAGVNRLSLFSSAQYKTRPLRITSTNYIQRSNSRISYQNVRGSLLSCINAEFSKSSYLLNHHFMALTKIYKM